MKKDKFSTFDIERILGIKRSRLQEWIDRRLITPDIPAKGKGTKAVFSLNSLYCIALFDFLLDVTTREQAKELHVLDFSNISNKGNRFLTAAISRFKNGKYIAYTCSETLSRDIPEIKEDEAIIVTVNLIAIKNYVDNLL